MPRISRSRQWWSLWGAWVWWMVAGCAAGHVPVVEGEGRRRQTRKVECRSDDRSAHRRVPGRVAKKVFESRGDIEGGTYRRLRELPDESNISPACAVVPVSDGARSRFVPVGRSVDGQRLALKHHRRDIEESESYAAPGELLYFLGEKRVGGKVWAAVATVSGLAGWVESSKVVLREAAWDSPGGTDVRWQRGGVAVGSWCAEGEGPEGIGRRVVDMISEYGLGASFIQCLACADARAMSRFVEADSVSLRAAWSCSGSGNGVVAVWRGEMLDVTIESKDEIQQGLSMVALQVLSLRWMGRQTTVGNIGWAATSGGKQDIRTAVRLAHRFRHRWPGGGVLAGQWPTSSRIGSGESSFAKVAALGRRLEQKHMRLVPADRPCSRTWLYPISWSNFYVMWGRSSGLGTWSHTVSAGPCEVLGCCGWFGEIRDALMVFGNASVVSSCPQIVTLWPEASLARQADSR